MDHGRRRNLKKRSKGRTKRSARAQRERKKALVKRSKAHVKYTIIERKKTAHVRVRGRFKTTRRKLSAVKAREATAGERSLTNLKTLVDNLPDITFVKDRDHRYVLVNKPFCAFLGKRKDQVLGKTAHDLYPKDVADISEEFDEQVFELGVTVDSQERERPDARGVARILQTKKAPLKDTEGNVTHLIGISRDITERKQMEEKLRESEDLYRRLTETSPDSVFVHIDGKFMAMNSVGARLLGASDPKELIGRSAWDFLHPDFQELVKERLRQTTECGVQAPFVDQKLVRLDGSVVDVEVASAPLTYQGKQAVQVVARDITERKKMEETLRRSEEMFRRVFRSNPLPGTITLPEGSIVDVNDAWVRMSGYSREEAVGRSSIELGMLPDPEERGRIVNDLLKKRRLSNVEITRRTKSDELRHLLNTLELVELGGQTCILNMQVDITDRKKTEESLRVSEARYRAVCEDQTELICRYSSDGKMTFVNEAYCRYFGKKRNELLEHVFMPLPKEDHERVRGLLATITADNPTISYDERVILSGGEVRWQQWTDRGIFDKQNRLVETQSVGRDITERKRMEEALWESEGNLQSFIDAVQSNAYVIDTEGTILLANQWVAKRFGKPHDQLIGSCIYDLVSPGVVEHRRAQTDKVIRSGRPVMFESTRGEEYFDYRLFPIFGPDGKVTKIAVLGTDVTERKRMQEELRRHSEHLEELVEARTVELKTSEEKYRLLIDNMTDAVFTIDLKGRITFCNQAVEKMTGYSMQQLLSMNMTDVIAPEHMAEIQRRLEARIRGEKYLPPHRFEIVRADGERLPIEMTTSAMAKEGNLIGIQGIVRDISERRKAEEGLRRSEEKFRQMYDASLNAMYTTTLDGKIVDMNPAGVSMFGYDSLDELKKSSAESLYANPDERKKTIELISKGPIRTLEVQYKKKDGEIFDALANAYPIKDNEGRIIGFQGAIIDITERRELDRTKDQLTHTLVQDAIRRKELEEMRNQFISAVTHELRTPLVSIKGYLDLALSRSISEEVHSDLLVVNRNTERLLSLTNDLLDIQRMQAGRLQLNPQPLDLREVIDSSITDVQPLTQEKKVSLRLKIPEGKLPIQGDEIRLSQVIVNLLSNAIKFSSDGGEVTLRAEEAEDMIKVQVSDRGIGIKREDLGRVFEPFAAISKPTYIKGTGLGLSISKGLVEAHGGKIWAESEGKGKGAMFTFTLPKRKEVI